MALPPDHLSADLNINHYISLYARQWLLPLTVCRSVSPAMPILAEKPYRGGAALKGEAASSALGAKETTTKREPLSLAKEIIYFLWLSTHPLFLCK